MVWAGRDLKDHLIPRPVVDRAPLCRQCCSEDHPTWPDQAWGIHNFSGKLLSAWNMTLHVCGVFRHPLSLIFSPRRRQQRSYLGCKSRKIAPTRSVESIVSWGKGSLGESFIFSCLKFFSTEQQAVSAICARFPSHVGVFSIKEGFWKNTCILLQLVHWFLSMDDLQWATHLFCCIQRP